MSVALAGALAVSSPNLTVYAANTENNTVRASGVVKTAETDNSNLTIKNGVLTKYSGTAAELDLSGYTDITAIGRSAFSSNQTFLKIKLPASITVIDEGAFQSCSNLVEVSFAGDGLVVVGSEAFCGCSALSKFELPSTVETIKSSAFQSTAISEITIPSVCTEIGSFAFYNSSLKKVNFSERTEELALGSSVFKSTALESIVLPEQVTKIPASAFSGCGSLKSVTIPETCINIGKSAFSGCRKMESIKLPSGIEQISEYTFSSCSSLKEIKIPEHCTMLGNDAFLSCSELKSIEIPDGCVLGSSVFYNSGLTKVEFLGGCPSIESQAFVFTNLTEIDIPEDCAAYGDNMLPGGVTRLKIRNKDADISRIFWNTPNSLVVYGESGGKTEEVAKSKNWKFQRFSDSITVAKQPEKNQYYYGDSLDLSGMELSAGFSSSAEPTSGTVSYKDCVITGYDSKKVGQQNLDVEYGGAKTTCPVSVYYDLSKATANSVSNQSYTGKTISPEFIVKGNITGARLEEGKDYTVSWEGDHTSVGSTTATLTGIGNYRGTKTITFNIVKKSISEKDVTVELPDMTYDGKERKPVPVVKAGDIVLGEDSYTYSYGGDLVNASDDGDAYITIKGQGNYDGTKTIEYNIAPMDASVATISAIRIQEYTGYELEPDVEVILDGKKLKESTDYSVEYTDNYKVGTAKVSVTFRGNYKGSVETTFEIKGSLNKATVSKIPDQTYTGKEIKPELEVYDGMTKLTENVDYHYICVNNKEVGTADVTIEGIGKYTGTITKTFYIGQRNIQTATIEGLNDKEPYVADSISPKVTVVCGDVTLEEQKDYEITYSNNTNIGTATVTIEGVGNYKGTVSKTFSIYAKTGSKFRVGSYNYTIKSSSEVTFSGLAKTVKSVTIPDSVKIGGRTFKVTAVANSALKGKKITSLTIGANVTSIGKEAFKSCSSLSKITIKSTKLKTVGSNALKGIKAAAKIGVPSSKLKAYQKLLKGKGQDNKVVISKNKK